MRIVFFGTPEFASICLQKIIETNHTICAVVTVPDKEKGRGKKKSFSPVKGSALYHKLRVLQPENLRVESFINQIKNIEFDVGVVVAFRILPREVYNLAPRGMFNLHGSLLPKYRGAAPIQWSLINGDKETGLTTFFLQDKVDTGNIILQEKVKIEEEDDFGTLHDRMAQFGSDLIIKTLEKISSGEVKTEAQNNSLASNAPKITKEMCLINWSKASTDIHNLVRGLSPIPAAYTIFNNKIVKIFKTKISDINSTLTPGCFEIADDKLFVHTGYKKILIEILQIEGRKKMTISDFLRGYRFADSNVKKFES
ncbi:MAG: methionyl-tRNA formyltransferase [Ignavibacteria bacterium]|nr:methionyl-tRNA formyltransferase [Ignavibacteria bacterium]